MLVERGERGRPRTQHSWKASCLVGFLWLASLSFSIPALAAATVLEELEIIAPASAGGGWDMTARAMQEVLEVTGITETVRVTNSPGAGGAIALAQFINARRGEGTALLVGGHVMLGAIRANQATVSLTDATPIARLTGEYQVIAVPVGSEFQSLQDLLVEMAADPGQVSWAGGSRGGTDHALVRLIARAIGVEPSSVNYIPSTAGPEAAAAVLANRASAGVSGYDEFAPYIKAGRLRALGLSSDERVPGIDTPTLKELGIDVALVNWRGVFAPPDISDEDRERLVRLTERMVQTAAWDYTLRKHYWTNLYLSGPAFADFLQAEESRVDQQSASEAASATRRWVPGILTSLRRAYRAWLSSRTAVAITLGTVLVLLSLFAFQRIRATRREQILSHDLEAAREEAERSARETRELLNGLGEEIERQFETWGLTAAEREVGRLMLKGLRHKEIAEMRHTSERTVRQQALAIYRKAGLEGRTDLAAYFLEDLLPPIDRGQGIA